MARKRFTLSASIKSWHRYKLKRNINICEIGVSYRQINLSVGENEVAVVSVAGRGRAVPGDAAR